MELFRPLLDPYVIISLIKQCSMLRNSRQHNFVHIFFIISQSAPLCDYLTLGIICLVQYLTLVATCITGSNLK